MDDAKPESTQFETRALEECDVKEVVAILDAAFGLGHSDLAARRFDSERVAVADGHVVGVVLASIAPEAPDGVDLPGPVCTVRMVAVDPSSRGLGIASRLVGEVCDDCGCRGALGFLAYAWVHATTGDVPLGGVLRSLGFVRARRIAGFYSETPWHDCPGCGQAPCVCPADVYVRTVEEGRTPALPGTLDGREVSLRRATRDDLPRLVAIVAEPEVAAWWPRQDEARLGRDLLEDADVTSYVVLVAGETVGAVMVTEETDPDYRSASVDLFLDAAHQGRGLGRDVLRTLARRLFDVGGHHRITIDPAVSNARALRAYERVGFQPVGVMRRYERGPDCIWRDAMLMDMLPEDLADD